MWQRKSLIVLYRDIYIRSFVADGNFKADHVAQKTGDTDIWLSEGGGMMPKREVYKTFLGAATQQTLVRTAAAHTSYRSF